MKLNQTKYIGYFILALIIVFILSVIGVNLQKSNEEYFVENTIPFPNELNVLTMAAEMNAPELNDILLEAGEWALVGAAIATTGATAAVYALAIKYARSAEKAAKTTKAIDTSYTLLNELLRPIFNARAKSFTKVAINTVPNVPGIYIFFKRKSGKVVYVGESLTLKHRLKNHLCGNKCSGNQLLSIDSKSLAFVAIPIKSIGDSKGAIQCTEAIAIKAFDDGQLYNKKKEVISISKCRQFLSTIKSSNK